MSADYSNDPWNLPTPVRKSSFVSIAREMARYNVETDLAGVGAFRCQVPPVAEGRLLYSDLQTCLLGSGVRRLGSGRSGYYRGKYLKGVGRTLLAGNWNEPEDLYHNSGHLLASGAIREYIVTCFLRTKGAGSCVVPCEGVLLKPASKELKGYLDKTFPAGSLLRGPKADGKLQAITVKPSNFSRHSNFLWLFENLPYARQSFSIGDYLARFFRDLFPPNTTFPGDDACTPAALAGALSDSILRGVANFRKFFELGIYWGSFHNNFTLDGRFLDLELPIILGRPYFGTFTREGRRRQPPIQEFMGMEVLNYVENMRLFLAFLRSRIDFWLARPRDFKSEERDFLVMLRRELARRIGIHHFVYSKRAIIAHLEAMILPALELTRAEQGLVRRMIRVGYLQVFSEKPVRGPRLSFVRGLSLARPEPHAARALYHPKFLGPKGAGWEEAASINEMICSMDQIEDLELLLDRLQASRRIIKQY